LLTTFPEFQKYHYFRKYSELTIEGDYKCINDFIKNSIESITKCRFQNDVLIKKYFNEEQVMNYIYEPTN
jgi:hypothetical protein